MLIMVNKLTGPASAGSGAGSQQASAAVVEAALEAALEQLKSKVAANRRGV